EGKVVRGSFDFATEVGHMVMIPGGEKCGCGQLGCLERYCSAKYSAQRAMIRLQGSPKLRRPSSLGREIKRRRPIDSVDIAAHAKAGDRFALQSWNEACRLLALACINVCHIVDPQMIVIGGGMSKAGRFLIDTVRYHFREQWWLMTKPTARLALATL